MADVNDETTGSGVIDVNRPALGQPSLYCDWVPTSDGSALEWAGEDSFEAPVEWIAYLDATFLGPWQRQVTGHVDWYTMEGAAVRVEIVKGQAILTELSLAHRARAWTRVLRAIAILLVMVFHYEVRDWPWRSGVAWPLWAVIREGWLGVDLFFVLSGFLITGILLDTRGLPGYFRNFYARRTLRIFPVYYGYLVAVFVLLPPVVSSVAATPAGVQWWFWTYASNLPLGVEGWRFSPGFVSHFWSLAIEEQFYLVWPAIVLFARRRTLAWTCVACIAGALAFRLHALSAMPDPVGGYVLTVPREGLGQVPIGIDDFEKIPEILGNPDKITGIGKNSDGLETIEYQKRFNGTVIYVQEVRTGRRELATKTMYKRKR